MLFRSNEDMGSSAGPGSSPMPSSPPAPFDVAHGADDDEGDDEGMEGEAEIQDDIDDIDEMADDDVDLFREGFEADYRVREDDGYEGEDLDDQGEYEDMDLGARRRLEAQLNRRDREVARRQRVPAAFLPGDDDDDDGDIDLTAQPRRRRHHYDEEADEAGEGDIMDEELSLEALGDVKAANLTEWVSLGPVQRTVKREFRAFLTSYTDASGSSVYGNRIRTLGEVNAETLEVSYEHLSESKAILAYFLANAPAEMLKLFDEVAMDVVLLHYPDYERIH